MNESEARRLGQQTASEDYATRDGTPPDPAYVRKTAQTWALRQMYRTAAEVPIAKRWEAAFLAGYAETCDALGGKGSSNE